MNGLSKAKLISYLVAIFVAGGVTGATIALTATKQTLTEPAQNGHMDARYLKDRFQSKLALSSEQAKVVEPILEKMSEDLKSIRGETSKRISAVMKNSCDQIGRELTPEQRKKLEEMKKDHPENTRRRFRPPSDLSRKSNSPPQNP